jgi:hypothetical protein
MSKDSKLSLINVSAIKVKESQAFSLNFKKENFSGRILFLAKLGQKVPEIKPVKASSIYWGFISGFLAHLSFYFSTEKSLRKILFYVPLPLFRLYFGLFKCVHIFSQRKTRCGRI